MVFGKSRHKNEEYMGKSYISDINSEDYGNTIEKTELSRERELLM